MDDDVNRAIKQLETIAIKAMNSGYLDDAAKVMHIAEEIERVDKSGAAAEAQLQKSDFDPVETATDINSPSGEIRVELRDDRVQDGQAKNDDRQDDEPVEVRLDDEQNEDAVPEVFHGENVVVLDRFRKKPGSGRHTSGTSDRID